MTRGRYQHLASPSKVAKVNRLRFFGHILRRPADRLVQRVLRSLSGSSWKKPRGRKRKFWTEVVKVDLRTLGMDRQFRRDVRIEKVGQSYVKGRHTSAKMQAIALGDDIIPPIKSTTARLRSDEEYPLDVRKFGAVGDVAFDSHDRPVLLSFVVRSQERNREAQHQSKLNLAGSEEGDNTETLAVNKDQYQSWLQLNQINQSYVINMSTFKDSRQGHYKKKFRQRVSINIVLRIRKIVGLTLSLNAFSTLQRKRSRQEKHVRKKLRRQLERDRENEWTPRAKEFEKAWEDKNPRKAYTLLFASRR
ncbi:hypothetical protein RB195_023869 [Necator americanus]|uniref:Uncharacterized protein n=1 Tax=Necator americanus TaxID=51031 RepID=A0ABR1EKW4_NECAM